MTLSGLPPGITAHDPRAMAAAAPYTFFLPPPDHISAVRAGDFVKAIFSDRDGGYDAERMWVRVEKCSPGQFVGTLDSDPWDMPNIEAGDPVTIEPHQVIAIRTGDNRALPHRECQRQYWDRCLVDACVLAGRSLVEYLYREEPDMTRDGDEHSDSGWRLRGSDAEISVDEDSNLVPQYVALGAVLDCDDRWLPLIDCEAGSRFDWDAARERFIPR